MPGRRAPREDGSSWCLRGKAQSLITTRERPRRSPDDLRHAGAHHGDHPDGVASWIENVPDHLIEVRGYLLGRELGDGGHRLDVAVAPGLDDRGEDLPWHPQRVDHHVVLSDVFQLQIDQMAIDVPADE